MRGPVEVRSLIPDRLLRLRNLTPNKLVARFWLPPQVETCERKMMPTSTRLATRPTNSRFRAILWVSLGITALFVFITSEVLLVTDYPMYHVYRLQVIADRGPPHPTHAMRQLCLAGRSSAVLNTFPGAPSQAPSHPGSSLFCLSHYWRFHGDRPCRWATRPARNLHAGSRLDRLHHRCSICRS